MKRLKQKNSIVVFGGSFNPPHNSHFSMAEQVLNEYEEVEKVIFVPVNKKYAKGGLEENTYRYGMLKMVVEKNSHFMLSDMDMYGDHSLYTIEVLEKVQEQFPEKEIWLLIGSDNLKEFSTWKRPEEIISHYKILVRERDEDTIEEILKSDELLNRYRRNIKILKEEMKNNISSTYIRQLIQENKSIRYLVPNEVYEYINKNHLYRREKR